MESPSRCTGFFDVVDGIEKNLKVQINYNGQKIIIPANYSSNRNLTNRRGRERSTENYKTYMKKKICGG